MGCTCPVAPSTLAMSSKCTPSCAKGCFALRIEPAKAIQKLVCQIRIGYMFFLLVQPPDRLGLVAVGRAIHHCQCAVLKVRPTLQPGVFSCPWGPVAHAVPQLCARRWSKGHTVLAVRSDRSVDRSGQVSDAVGPSYTVMPSLQAYNGRRRPLCDLLRGQGRDL
jgi:hypothetical protein